MAALSIEERVAALEAEVARLKQRSVNGSENGRPWWEHFRGAFHDDPDYDEAMRLGHEYRESLRPKDGENAAPECSSWIPITSASWIATSPVLRAYRAASRVFRLTSFPSPSSLTRNRCADGWLW